MTYGSDFSGVDDLDPFLTFLEGEDNEAIALSQALARRLTTQRYALFYDPTYGTDLRSYIADSVDSTIVQGAIGIECRKDPRVADVRTTITEVDESWTIAIVVTPQEGDTFTMTLSVDELTVELLTVT